MSIVSPSITDLVKDLFSKKSRSADDRPRLEKGIPLSEALINFRLATAFSESSQIKTLQVNLLEGHFTADATVSTARGSVRMQGDFAIDRFVINKDLQLLVLKMLGKPAVEPQHWMARIAASVMAVVLKLIFDQSLLEWGAKDIKGLAVAGDTITIDLAALGTADLIKQTIKNHTGVFGMTYALIDGVTEAALPSVTERIAVVRAVPSPEVLTVFVTFGG